MTIKDFVEKYGTHTPELLVKRFVTDKDLQASKSAESIGQTILDMMSELTKALETVNS